VRWPLCQQRGHRTPSRLEARRRNCLQPGPCLPHLARPSDQTLPLQPQQSHMVHHGVRQNRLQPSHRHIAIKDQHAFPLRGRAQQLAKPVFDSETVAVFIRLDWLFPKGRLSRAPSAEGWLPKTTWLQLPVGGRQLACGRFGRRALASELATEAEPNHRQFGCAQTTCAP